MTAFLLISGYVAGVVLAVVVQAMYDEGNNYDADGAATVALMWPVALGICVVVAPVRALQWLYCRLRA